MISSDFLFTPLSNFQTENNNYFLDFLQVQEEKSGNVNLFESQLHPQKMCSTKFQPNLFQNSIHNQPLHNLFFCGGGGEIEWTIALSSPHSS